MQKQLMGILLILGIGIAVLCLPLYRHMIQIIIDGWQ